MACHHAARNLPRYVYQGIVGIRRGRWGGDSPYPNTVLPCKDGHVILCSPQLAQWLRFLKVMGEPEWTQNPRYRDRRAMIADYPEEADALLIPWFKERTKAELLQIFIEHRIPFAPIFSGRELLECEHLRERGFFRPMPLGRDASGFVEAPGVPFRFGRSASHVERCGAPALGQDTRSVLVEELGLSPSEYESLVRAGLV
jgi:CoA:oxalate CoA-transferase